MAKTAAQEFLDKVLAKVPEGEREAVRAEYSKAADEIALQQRSLEDATAAVRETATKQNEWWNAHKNTVAENADLKKKLETGGGTALTNEAIKKELGDLEDRVMGTGLSVMTMLTDIGVGHFQEFGERLNTSDLAAKAMKAGMPLQQYYDAQVAERRQARDTEARKKEIAEAEDRGKKAGIEETTKTLGSAHMPFPGQSAGVLTAPRTLDGLKRPADGAAPPDVLSAAVATAMDVASRQ